MAGESAYYDIRIRVFDKPLDDLEKKTDRFEKKIGGLGQSLKGAFAGAFAAVGAGALLSQLKDLSIEAVNVTREFQNMTDAIRFASGDRGNENLQFLNSTIKDLGLDINSTYKGFKTFQGALMGTTLEGEKGLEIFKAVSEAASVMKLSADQTEGTFLALGQMISKGNVQAEELRGQLGERLPGAFNIFARALGVSTQQLNKMLQNGEVIAQDTLPLFAAELRKTFSPGVAGAQKSFNADMNRFNNFLLESKIILGEQLIPTIHEWIKIIPQINFKPLADSLKIAWEAATGLFSILGDILKAFGIGVDKANAFQSSINFIGAVFKTIAAPVKYAVDLMRDFIDLLVNSKPIFGGIAQILLGNFSTGIDMIKYGWENFQEAISKRRAPMQSAVDTALPTSGTTSYEQTPRNIANNGAQSGQATKTGVEKISSATRNVTLNITKLIENLNFTKDQAKNEYDMEEMVKRVLLRAVNDVNIVAQ